MGEQGDRFWPYVGADNLEVYEWLNRCTDSGRRIESLMWNLGSWQGKVMLDIGAGSGFHAERYAQAAAHVCALEPDQRMLDRLRLRIESRPLKNVTALAGLAGAIPLLDASVDRVVARFAYFFGTDDCLPGLREVRRVLRPGGHFFVIEGCADRGQMGRIMRRCYPQVFSSEAQDRVRGFFRDRGFHEHAVDTWFRAPSRQVLEQVMRMDFPGHVGEIMSELQSNELSQSLWLFHWREPSASEPSSRERFRSRL